VCWLRAGCGSTATCMHIYIYIYIDPTTCKFLCNQNTRVMNFIGITFLSRFLLELYICMYYEAFWIFLDRGNEFYVRKSDVNLTNIYTLYETLLLSRSAENKHSIKMDSSVLKVVAPKIGLIDECNSRSISIACCICPM
jgi:hypothetical protein